MSARLVGGDPVEVLNRQAERAAVLVLGSRPLPGVRELFNSGSVTLSLTAHAGCPVVVVRDPEHVTQQPAYVVVGVDGSRTSQDAVDYAFEAAVLRCCGAAGRRESYPEVELMHEVVRGHPVAVLTEASRHALFPVVGTRGAGGFTGQLLGSVGQGVLHHARCPVATVPGPVGPGGRR